MTASFNSSIPPTAVYLVLPLSMAAIAAFFMLSGVSRSGSPAPNPMTSMPRERISFALTVTARVADSSSPSILLDILTMRNALGLAEFFLEPLDHVRGYERVHVPAEPRYLFYEPRTYRRVTLGRHHENRLYVRGELSVREGHLKLVLEVRHHPESP